MLEVGDAQVEGEVGISSGQSHSCWSLPFSSISALQGWETGPGPRALGPNPPPPPPPRLLITCLPLPLLQLHYQHQVVQNLHRLWYQYMVLPYKAEEGRPNEEEHTAPRAWAARSQSSYLDKTTLQVDSLAYPKGSALEPQQENAYFKETQDAFRPQRVRVGTKASPRKSIMEEILVEGSRDWDSTKSPWEQAGLPPPEWDLCLEDFREVGPRR